VLLAEPIANALRTPEQQESFQARADFIGAVLRKESGAAITTAEYAREEARYFPRPSDSVEVLLQKARARERVIQALEKESGQKLGEPIVADTSSYFKRSVGYYRNQFQSMDAETANADLIKRNYAATDQNTINSGTLAFKQVFGTEPKYVAYGAKTLPKDIAELTPGAVINLTQKVRDAFLPTGYTQRESDAWLIVLDGMSDDQLASFSRHQRAAIKTRQKQLGLPRQK
jgi:hypothetical protein